MPNEQQEPVAEAIYDWIHENQVTHRRTYNSIPEDQKRAIAQLAGR